MPLVNPLASAPLTGVTCACLGDSHISNGFTSVAPGQTGAAQNFTNWGLTSWVRFLTNQNVLISNGYNFGVGGNTLTQISARVGNVLALNPTFCMVEGGTNDLPANTTAAAMESTWLNQIILPLINAGVVVLVTPIVPRASSALTTAQLRTMQRFNSYVREFCYGRIRGGNANVILCDATPLLTDYTNANGDSLSTLFYDSPNLHPNAYGCYFYAQPFAAALALLTAPMSTQLQHNADIFDATNNPAGNVLRSSGTQLGNMAGTGGSATSSTGFTASGSVATGWTMQRTSGTSTATGVGSKENPRTDLPNSVSGVQNGERQICAFATSTTGTSDEQYELRFTNTLSIGSGDFQIGDQVYAECTLEMSSLTNVTAIELQVNEFGGTFTQQTYDMARSSANSQTMPAFATAQRGRMRTDIITLQSGSTSITYKIVVHMNVTSGNGGATIKVADCSIRKVAS